MEAAPLPAVPAPIRVAGSGVPGALSEGWRVLRRVPGLSLAYGGVFALGGTLALWGMQWLRLAPMTLPVFGAFLLVGPVAMAGLLAVSDALRSGQRADAHLVLAALRHAPRGLWALAFFCGLMFFIALSDAGTLFSFLVGEPVAGLAAILPQGRLVPFHLSAGATGGALATAVFLVSVHGVPLLAARRATLVGAVVASVRAVFASPLAHGLWAAVIALGVFGSIVAPPVLALVLPLLAYAGDAFHRSVFPD